MSLHYLLKTLVAMQVCKKFRKICGRRDVEVIGMALFRC
jgi:hypothetical protein